jgi:hypothetical protein
MSHKDMIIQHHKLGKIPLGKIPKNEICRMVIQLLEQQRKQSEQLNASVMLINKIPQKTRDKYIKEIKVELEKKHAEARKDVKTNKPVPSQ